MLCRVAESVYWMSRYVERAENVARFISVNENLTVGGAAGIPAQWAPLIYATGSEDLFNEVHGDFSYENVVQFLLFEERNPSSVLSCLQQARANARTIRNTLSTPFWQALNRVYLRVRDTAAQSGRVSRRPQEFLDWVRESSHLLTGVADATMSHGEAWNFARMGQLLERADSTSRILDVKYFILLPRPADVGTPLDVVQWAALLESTSALQMYRRRYGRIVPEQVVEFLVLDRAFPRSIHFCVSRAQQRLHEITGSAEGHFSNPAEQKLGRVVSYLRYTTVDDIISGGLHEFMDQFQIRVGEIGEAVAATFFGLQPASEPDGVQQDGGPV